MSRYHCYECGGIGHRCNSKTIEEIQDELGLPFLWPSQNHARTVYAIEFGSLVKVGITLNLRRRLKALPRERRSVLEALRLTDTLARPHVLGARVGTFATEQAVLTELKPFVAWDEWIQNTPEVQHILVGWNLDSFEMPTSDYRANGLAAAI